MQIYFAPFQYVNLSMYVLRNNMYFYFFRRIHAKLMRLKHHGMQQLEFTQLNVRQH